MPDAGGNLSPLPWPADHPAFAAGRDFFDRKDYVRAEACFRDAIVVEGPAMAGNTKVLPWLGKTQLLLKRPQEAAATVRTALRMPMSPDARAEALLVFAKASEDCGHAQEALEAYEEAARLRPESEGPLISMACLLGNIMGRMDDAVAMNRRILALQPGVSAYHSNLLLSMHYRTTWTPEQVFAEHLAWDRAHGQYPKEFFHAPRPPGRRLRIGYVAKEFRRHAVAYFFDAVLRHRDRVGTEVFLYSDMGPEDADAVTAEFRGMADHWRDIKELSNAQAAALVHGDQIDILVDLVGHAGTNRLRMFARKPAPVQATYLGYPDTTGLASMDYRIVDALTDPPGMTERYHSEELVRLPGVFLCYTPSLDTPEVAPLPAAKGGGVTFCCFNSFTKVSPEWIGWVARILKRVPASRLAMKSIYFVETDGFRERIQAMFAIHGIGPERLQLLARTETQGGHMACHHQVDLALDPYPYHGTTTTCEALWMGVPVVTLAGPTHVSRVGVSLMTAVGLPDFVAQTPEEFVRLAVEKAEDLERLAEIRRTLRERMKPIADGPAHAAKLEAAYRAMWRAKAPR